MKVGLKTRWNAMKIGLSIMGEGIGFKSIGEGSFVSQMMRMLAPKWGEPPRRNTREWLEMFNTSPRLAPLRKTAEDVASTPWSLYVGEAVDNKKIEQHPLIDLLRNPNPMPDMTGYLLFYMTEAYLGLRGEAFWIIERNGLSTPSELYIVPPHWVAETPTIDNPFFTVETKSGSRFKVPRHDMVWFKEPDLVDPYGRGVGRAQGIEDEIETDEYMAKWAKKFFFNDAKPPVLIQAPHAQEADIKRIQESWMERYAGFNNAHKPAVLPWDAKVQELNKTQREMDFTESRKYIRDTSNQHFRVPPELMGIVENSNRATIDAADYLYKDNVLTNRLRLIRDSIQSQLVVQFDEKLNFQFDNVVPENSEFNLQKANDGLDRGAITVNEWRRANGFDDLPGKEGDIRYVPFGSAPAQNQQDNSQNNEGTNNSEDIDDEKSYIPVENVRKKRPSQQEVFQTYDKVNRKHEAHVQKALARVFKNQQHKATTNFIAQAKKLRKSDDPEDYVPTQEELNRLLAGMLSWSKEAADMAAIMAFYLLASSQDAFNAAKKLYALDINFGLLRPEMLEYLETRGLEKVVGITKTTREALQKSLIEGRKNGEGITKLAQRVSKVFDDAIKRRSFVIARTEVHNTNGHGVYQTYVKADVKYKEWISTEDDRTRGQHPNDKADHVSLNGQVRAIDAQFSNGLMYPGDPDGAAEEVIQCRCVLAANFPDE